MGKARLRLCNSIPKHLPHFLHGLQHLPADARRILDFKHIIPIHEPPIGRSFAIDILQNQEIRRKLQKIAVVWLLRLTDAAAFQLHGNDTPQKPTAKDIIGSALQIVFRGIQQSAEILVFILLSVGIQERIAGDIIPCGQLF